jgi:hypothetical protein
MQETTPEKTSEKTRSQLIAQNLLVNPNKFQRFFKIKPTDAQFELATKRVSELIEDFELIILKLDAQEMDVYSFHLKRDPIAQVLLYLTFVDFYLETTSAVNRSKLSAEVVRKRQSLAHDIITYLRTQLADQVDDNKLFQWAIDTQVAPSAQPRRRQLESQLKSVQSVRPDSSTPPGS